MNRFGTYVQVPFPYPTTWQADANGNLVRVSALRFPTSIVQRAQGVPATQRTPATCATSVQVDARGNLSRVARVPTRLVQQQQRAAQRLGKRNTPRRRLGDDTSSFDFGAGGIDSGTGMDFGAGVDFTSPDANQGPDPGAVDPGASDPNSANFDYSTLDFSNPNAADPNTFMVDQSGNIIDPSTVDFSTADPNNFVVTDSANGGGGFSTIPPTSVADQNSSSSASRQSKPSPSGGGGGGGIPSGGSGGSPKSGGSPSQNNSNTAQQQKLQQLIASLSKAAGTVIAAKAGISPQQFAAQNPQLTPQQAAAAYQQLYGRGVSSGSSFSSVLSAIPWWGWGIGAAALIVPAVINASRGGR